jgi:hypothetical protein
MTSGNDSDHERAGSVDGEGETNGMGTNDTVPRPKRIACILCRKRKLRCDGGKPSCGTCARLKHNCEYSEERKKSGPKRGYVKLLEARLKQVENLLETRENTAEKAPQNTTASPAQHGFTSMPTFNNSNMGDADMSDMLQDTTFTDPMLSGADNNFTLNGDFSWELMGLGLEEPLPSREVIDELYGEPCPVVEAC